MKSKIFQNSQKKPKLAKKAKIGQKGQKIQKKAKKAKFAKKSQNYPKFGFVVKFWLFWKILYSRVEGKR
jgi:hypothetical protein